MARIEQTVTIKFDPKDLDRLIEAIRRGPVAREAWTVDYEGAEPITIVTPDGRSTAGKPSTTTTRYMFIDGDNQEHWTPSVRAGRDRGWRQAFFLPGR
jgi:hypothetical protein